MGIRVGIDLGTTFCAVARIDQKTGKPQIIKNSFGSATTPSVLCFEKNGNVLFGEDAKNMQSVGDTNAVAFFKRSMGNHLFCVELFGKKYNSTDFSAILLRKLKEEAEQQCGETIDSAVITVPAYFTHIERTETLTAGKRAGLDVIAIINEPTAAAFAYGLNEKDYEQTVLIYDLGGGTFDATLARINKDEIKILGSDGDHELGGKDWDDCIARYLANEFYEKYGEDISEDPEMIASLLVTAENVKKQLTQKDVVNVPIHYKNIRGTVEITEETFEEISQFLIGTTKEVVERLMQDVNITWNDIDGVILVGGSTRMRMIHNYIVEMSGKEPLGGVNVDEAVALGAAIRANITEKGETVPALGGMFRRRDSGICIKGAKAVSDVTAHSLGMISISADGEEYVNSVIIKKNTPIPAGNTKAFTFRTREKNNELEVYVLQGDYKRPLDNTVINKYVISKIQKTSPANSVIEVTYKYNANGVIEVSAVQKETGKNLPIRIEPVPEDMSWADGSPKDNPNNKKYLPTVDVILAIDLSGSMSGDPTIKAMVAMKDFVRQMDPKIVRVGVVAFADSTKELLSPTSHYRAVQKTISGLESVNVGGGTGAEPFSLSYKTLTKSDSDVKYIVVLTDGCWFYPAEAIAKAEQCHREGIEIMALGFGSADYDFLKKIASTDEFASLTDLSNLSGSFSKIAQVIGETSTGISVF